jgi:hypothetical protein
MDYLKQLTVPLTMSGLLLGISVLTFWGIDLYAVVITLSYFVFTAISNLGGRYFDLTGQREIPKMRLKMFVDPPSVFFNVLGLFYVMTGDLHWIFIGGAAFLTFIIFVIASGDLSQAKEKIKLKNENNSL